MNTNHQQFKEIEKAVEIIGAARKKLRITRGNEKAITIAFMTQLMITLIEHGFSKEEAALSIQSCANANVEFIQSEMESPQNTH